MLPVGVYLPELLRLPAPLFTSQNPVAMGKQENSYGEYFLYGEYDGKPVYQHFAGVEYLYHRDGNWLISDKIGLREAGMQNQGEDNPNSKRAVCPYHFRTSWEYADVDQPGGSGFTIIRLGWFAPRIRAVRRNADFTRNVIIIIRADQRAVQMYG